MHPEAIKIGNLSREQVFTLMRKFNEERDKRLPAAVRTGEACMVCYATATTRCRCSWGMCHTCAEELENNCLQCLYEDQKDKAAERMADRTKNTSCRT